MKKKPRLGSVALSLVGTPIAIGSSLAFAAGVMTYITVDGLIPVAHEYDYKHSLRQLIARGYIRSDDGCQTYVR
jgi:zinc transporter ZupT